MERERTYIAAWQDMGFDNEALRLAYEKTVMKKQSMDWGYMNGILRRWHEKGLHTVAAIQAGDGLRQNRGGAPAQGRTPQPGEERPGAGGHGADAPPDGADEAGGGIRDVI